jgi:hypothetical protein
VTKKDGRERESGEAELQQKSRTQPIGSIAGGGDFSQDGVNRADLGWAFEKAADVLGRALAVRPERQSSL